MNNKRLIKILNVMLLVIIVFCGLKIFQKHRGYYVDSKTYENLRNMSPLTDSTLNKNPNEKKEDSLNEKNLKNINSDYSFWIKVDGTNVDFPVVQGKDNDFYLKHDFNKEKSFSGSIFVDYNNDVNKDKNIVIYGHNMKNDAMFAQMNQFKNPNFFDANKYITLYRHGEQEKYEIFSVYQANAKDLKLSLSFPNNEDFYKYEKDQASKSLFKRDLTLTPEDKIITLVTCGYEFDDARIVIVAKEVK